MCTKKYKSGLGMLSHVETCGLDKLERMVNCCYCKRNVNKVYIGSHLRSCNTLFDINLKERMDVINTKKVGKEIVLGKTGRIKRDSMLKAEANMQNTIDDFDPDMFIRFPVLPRKGVYNKWKKEVKAKVPARCYFKNCKFFSTNLNDMKTHIATCPEILTLPLTCLKCDFSHQTIDVIRKHIVANHRDEPVATNDDSEASLLSDDSDDDVSSGVDENEDPKEDESVSEEPKAKPKRRKAPAKDKSLSASIPTPSKSTNTKPENKYRKCKFNRYIF